MVRLLISVHQVCAATAGRGLILLYFTHLIGAISWAIVNLIIGPMIDYFGFVSFYPFAMVVTVLYFISIALYVKGQDGSREQIPQHDNLCH